MKSSSLKYKCNCRLCKFIDIKNKFETKLNKTENEAINGLLNEWLCLSEDVEYIQANLDKSWPDSEKMTDIELLSFVKRQLKNINN